MDYILKRKNQYYFNRRVPGEFREFDTRKIIRVSLNTDSLKEAIRLSRIQNQLLEKHWDKLFDSGEKQKHVTYDAIVNLAKLLGVTYMPNQELVTLPLEVFSQRIIQAKPHINNGNEINALLGGTPLPDLKLSEIITKFYYYTKGSLWNKSEYQIRKWKNPRTLAMRNFVNVVGDKNAILLNKDDMLKYQEWWLNRMEDEKMSPKTADKHIIHVKTIIDTVNDHMKINLDVDHLFKKLTFKSNKDNARKSFETDYLLSVFLNLENLKGLNEQARQALYAFAETGAGASELVGLLPEDIKLDCDIPHIIIQPKQKNELKTRYRKRIIPLVGFALDAFKALPNGFTDYADNPENLSATLGKYLKENKLFPTEQHTVYSLRHSFQDRLLAANAPDRVQADLMGHKFNRPSYGDGASLGHKLQWLNKIQLKELP